MIAQSLTQIATTLLLKIRAREPDVKRQAQDIITHAEKWIAAGQTIVASWSGSYCGYHSELYFDNFELPPLRLRFSPEWGGTHGLPDGWDSRPTDEVKAKMQALAGAPLEPIEASAGELMKSLKQLQEDLVDELYPLYNQSGFEKQKELLGKIENFKWGSSRGQYIKDHTPTQFGTRDSEAINQGIKVPDHLYFEAVAAECFSRSQSAAEFLKLSLRLLKTLDVPAVTGTSSTRGKKVFIGHGGSLLWLKLRIFLLEKLHLECDEFNEESPAGIPTATRLKTMVDEAKFAFLVMTSEDFHADGTTHARENVVHEAGLFQGHLGFDKAIILLEEGCAEFSNIHGLGQIRFPKNNIEAIFEKIRDVLKQRGIT